MTNTQRKSYSSAIMKKTSDLEESYNTYQNRISSAYDDFLDTDEDEYNTRNQMIETIGPYTPAMTELNNLYGYEIRSYSSYSYRMISTTYINLGDYVPYGDYCGVVDSVGAWDAFRTYSGIDRSKCSTVLNPYGMYSDTDKSSEDTSPNSISFSFDSLMVLCSQYGSLTGELSSLQASISRYSASSRTGIDWKSLLAALSSLKITYRLQMYNGSFYFSIPQITPYQYTQISKYLISYSGKNFYSNVSNLEATNGDSAYITYANFNLSKTTTIVYSGCTRTTKVLYYTYSVDVNYNSPSNYKGYPMDSRLNASKVSVVKDIVNVKNKLKNLYYSYCSLQDYQKITDCSPETNYYNLYKTFLNFDNTTDSDDKTVCCDYVGLTLPTLSNVLTQKSVVQSYASKRINVLKQLFNDTLATSEINNYIKQRLDKSEGTLISIYDSFTSIDKTYLQYISSISNACSLLKKLLVLEGKVDADGTNIVYVAKSPSEYYSCNGLSPKIYVGDTVYLLDNCYSETSAKILSIGTDSVLAGTSVSSDGSSTTESYETVYKLTLSSGISNYTKDNCFRLVKEL